MLQSKKEKRYIRIIDQLKPLLLKTIFLYAKMATINAVLYHKMDNFFWVGFYILENDHLFVGPYQGALACQELDKNKGVCWDTINSGKAIVVPDVTKYPDHIACDTRSKSEITIPLKNQEKVFGVLDIDSQVLDNFDQVDIKYLTEIIQLIV